MRTHIYPFIIFFALLSFSGYGQSIEGKIIDQESGEPLYYAQVALKDTLENIKGSATTGDAGEFRIETSPGKYIVQVTYLGYEDKTMEVELREGTGNLGTIEMASETAMLEEVKVQGTAIRQSFKATMEGLEINPDQTISNTGGTLLDILRNTPSVRVNNDGSVTLRGSNNTNILINGRNSVLGDDLEQIPASSIKKINIINNPNARYDADAAGGIIDIQMKQGGIAGTSGRVEATAGTRWRHNLSGNLTYASSNWELYSGYTYRSWPRVGSGFAERETFTDNELLTQHNINEDSDVEHNVNYGAKYTFGKNRISYEGVFNTEDEFGEQYIRSRSINTSNNSLINQYVRRTDETEENYSLDNAITYERLFDGDERSLRASVSYSFRDQLEEEGIYVFNGVYDIKDTNRPANSLQRSISDEYRGTAVLQFDYRFPALSGELETGYKTTIREYDNDFDYEIFDDGDGQWINQSNVSNRFLYEEQVHAAYVIYNKEVGDWSFSAGTRAEQAIINTTLFDTGEENEQNYLQLFPSVQTAYRLNDQNTVRATYSRRIDRPGSWHLNPFPDVSDSLNIRIGDPNLQPEYINSFEVGHMYNKGVFNLSSTAFYRRTNNQIDWIVRVEDGISYRGPKNLLTQDVYGFEVIGSAEILPWWQVNASYSFFGVQVDGSNLDDAFINSGQSWYAKMNSDFILPWGINLQLTGNYTSPEIEAQGRDLARYYVDASVRKDFLDKKIRLSLSMRDIFDTRNFAGENYGSDFRQTFEWKRETQIFLASLSYTFGGYKDNSRGDRRR